jgi:primosomal protein N' (replication factor Y)
VERITSALQSYRCFLLQGVTGSGKTEVYLQVVAQVLALGRQVLILVPEIGLTPQLLARFTLRFKVPMAVIHSNLNDTERQVAWQLAKEGLVKLIIGTRAAIFTPLPTLGLIVIDEEHDNSLKQMEGVRYSARDTALMRAHANNIPIILGSATPSLESIHNCQLEKYQLLRLNHKAMVSTPLHYQLIDIRNQFLQQGIAESVLQTITTHLEQHNQVLVFINRRGFAPVLLCHQCGWMADCTACDSHLTLHRSVGQLICHHCGLTQSIPIQCKACKSRDLVPVGLGTQRVYDYLSSQFPKTEVLRIDRDAINTKHGLEEQLNLIHRGEAQLIIGTQMLAKGHHFPRLTLVVVLDADTGFFNQDFRALENLGQLLTQVAGRAGRAQHPGQVLIQTHIPQHPLLTTLISQGYDAFANELLVSRKAARLPPYHFLALIRAQAKNEAILLQCLHTLKKQLITDMITVMGPAPAPLARKANQHRMQLLITSPSRKKLQITLTELRAWLTINNKVTNGVRWNVDVDPMDLI